jgi:hypothetical protein
VHTHRSKKLLEAIPRELLNGSAKKLKLLKKFLATVGIFAPSRCQRGCKILEKTGCEHVKVATQIETVFFVDNTKDPSAEATMMGGKFYSNIWMKGGWEIADEAIKKNEKESHDAREEAKRTEEAAERARCIGIFIES